MRALITGITGFVGQYLTEHLLDCGDQVIGSTYRDTWSPEVARRVGDQVAVFEWNLGQSLPDEARRLLRQFAPDCVIHLAAISIPSECGTGAPNALSRAVNVAGTGAVLELAASLPRPPRVLFVSSAHVYAPVAPDHPQVKETSPVGPTGAYGQTKLEAEQLCQQAASGGLDVVVVRAFQHAGPRQLPKFMLPEWAQQFAAAGDQPIEVVTLDSYVDLSDVRDIVRAYRMLVVGPTAHRLYNVGSGRAVHGRQVFDLLGRLSGQQRSAVELHPGVRRNPIANIARLVGDTSWAPRIAVEQTVADTLAEFQQRRS